MTKHKCKHCGQGYGDDWLINIISNIRIATGVNDRPMLSELPDAIGAVIERQEAREIKLRGVIRNMISMLGNPDAAEGCRIAIKTGQKVLDELAGKGS